jgi:hypothetical protein
MRVYVHVQNYGAATDGPISIELADIKNPKNMPIALIGATGATCSPHNFFIAIICQIPAIGAGRSAYMWVDFYVQGPGPNLFEVTAFSGNEENNISNNRATITFSATPLPDLVAQVLPAETTYEGTEFTLTYWFTNTAAPLTDVSMVISPVTPGFEITSGGFTYDTSAAPNCALKGTESVECTVASWEKNQAVVLEVTLDQSPSAPSDGWYEIRGQALPQAGTMERDSFNNTIFGLVCKGNCGAAPAATPTNTPISSPIPPDTPVPLTSTPTATHTATDTATNTPVTPKATDTLTPTATRTPVPATSTPHTPTASLTPSTPTLAPGPAFLPNIQGPP